MPLPKEVFIAYSDDDRHIVNDLVNELDAYNIKTWFSQNNIFGGQAWQREIGNALKRCDYFIVILTNNSITSYWVRQELEYAFNHNQYRDKIIPLLIEQCDYENLSWILGNIQHIDMTNSIQVGLPNLLGEWGIII